MKHVWRFTLVVSLAACSDAPTEPAKAGMPGLHILSGASITDTIETVLTAPLLVELRDTAGDVLAGDTVVFNVAFALDLVEVDLLQPSLLKAGVALTAVTDNTGRASARVQFGRTAGRAAIVVSARRSGYADTAQYTVIAGQPASVELKPADTAMFADRTLALRSVLRDRGGNTTAGAITYAVLAGPVAVSSSGTVSAASFGVARIEARAGSGGDTVRVAVVPHGAIVASSTYQGILVMNLDGSGFRQIADRGFNPGWSAIGDRVVYESDYAGGRLLLQPLNGPATLLIQQDTTRGWQTLPMYSRDGRYIYFTTSAPNEPQEMWRVGADGLDLRRISPRPPISGEVRPSPSPDGHWLAFYAATSTAHIRVRDLANGATSGNLAEGQMPAWSPTDDRIAFNEYGTGRGIMMLRADGTGLRRMTPAGSWYNFGVNWSPDGRWLIAVGADSPNSSSIVRLIEVDTGLIIPLTFLLYPFINAAWRPGGLLP